MASDLVDLRSFLPASLRSVRAAELSPNVVTEAFSAALSLIHDAWSSGRGDPDGLYVPPGTWRVEALGSPVGVSLETPGMTLRGAGVRATTIAMVGDRPAHTIAIRAAVTPSGSSTPIGGVTVERLTVVGNRLTTRSKAGGHGIAVRDNASDVVIRDVCIEDSASNAIGFERSQELRGVFDDFTIHNVNIRRCGRSAVDIKNYDADDPERSGAGGLFRSVVVDGVCLNWEPGDPQGAQHAFHVRGRRILHGIDVRAPRGVWFENKLAGPVNGRGAQHSVLENYNLEITDGVAIAARSVDCRAKDAHWRLVTDPRDAHDERILPLDGVRYWSSGEVGVGPPRGLPAAGEQELGGWRPVGLGGWPEWPGARAEIVDGAGADVLARWRFRVGDGCRPAVGVRGDRRGRALVAVVDTETDTLGLWCADPTRWVPLSSVAVDWPDEEIELRLMASGPLVEVATGLSHAPVLVHRLEGAPARLRGSGVLRVDLEPDRPTHWSSFSQWSSPPPEWAGTVREVDPPTVQPSGLRRPVQRFEGSFVDLSDVVSGKSWKNTVAIEFFENRCVTMEFEVHGEARPWIPCSESRVWIAASGGPGVRSSKSKVDGRQSVVLPVQVVQRHLVPSPGDPTDQGRYPVLAEFTRSGQTITGCLTCGAVDDRFEGFDLAFELTASRRP